MARITIPKSISSKYAGLTAVIYKNKAIAGGATTLEAMANAKKKFPKISRTDVSVMSLPPRGGVWVL